MRSWKHGGPAANAHSPAHMISVRTGRPDELGAAGWVCLLFYLEGHNCMDSEGFSILVSVLQMISGERPCVLRKSICTSGGFLKTPRLA